MHIGKAFRQAAVLVVVGVFALTLKAQAATSPMVLITVTPKNQGEKQYTYLRSLNLTTGKITNLRSFLNDPYISPNWISGSYVTFKKGEDLYVGRTTTSAADRRVAKFTTCKLDPSCLINPIGISPNSQLVGYGYEHPYLYNRSTGKTKQLSDSQWFNEFSPTGKSLVQLDVQATDTNVHGLYLTSVATYKTRFIPLMAGTTPIAIEKMSPNDQYLVWATGGSTNSDTGITQPTKLTLTNLTTGKKVNTVPLVGGTMGLVWTSPTSLIAVQASGIDQHRTYTVYELRVVNGKLKGGKLTTFSDRQVTHVGLVNATTLVLWGANGANSDEFSYSTMTTKGKLSKVKTISNPKGDIYEFVK